MLVNVIFLVDAGKMVFFGSCLARLLISYLSLSIYRKRVRVVNMQLGECSS